MDNFNDVLEKYCKLKEVRKGTGQYIHVMKRNPKISIIDIRKPKLQRTIKEREGMKGMSGFKKAVCTPKGTFSSIGKAAAAHGVSATYITNRIQKKEEGWHFLKTP